jgi:glycosyl transferase family 2
VSGKPKTEQEQLAFFDGVHERFCQAIENVGEMRRHYRIAGQTLRLSFAGHRLVPYLTRALQHLEIGAVESPDATFCLWDSVSTRVTMLPPPCDREGFSDRGDLWGFNSKRIKTAFHYHDYSVNLFDHDRRTGIYWVQDADLLPYWVLASPVRTLFHWWMERHGCQLVHAAAVGVGDRALLLVGKGGLGKSSTALTCLEAGLDFMGDDYVIVRNEPTPTVYGLYATAKINREDTARFEVLRPLLSKQEVPPEEKGVLFLHPHFRPRLRLEMPLQAVAIPQVVDRDRTVLVPEAAPLVQQAASFTTMSQLPYAGNHTHHLFASLCEALPGYRIELGRDPEGVSTAVADFLADRSRRSARIVAAARPSEAPLVSVVIPVYNGERFVADAVGSVLAQGYPSLEIIVIDDGSTDGTEAVVRRLPCDVHYFKQENLGPAAARNRGIRDASGDFVAFLDADDLWPPHTLHTLVGALLLHEELDLVQGYSQVMEYDPISGAYEYRGNPKESFPYSISLGVYRKRVFDRVGLFDKTLLYGEDTDWYNRAHEMQVAMKRVDAVTLHVRRHGENMTHEKSLVELNMLRVLKMSLDRRRAAGSSA